MTLKKAGTKKRKSGGMSKGSGRKAVVGNDWLVRGPVTTKKRMSILAIDKPPQNMLQILK
ncbi:MAG: hypothetical protein ABSG75_02780 [Syntrophales bacterium]|jgi:hypothetical protein